jgi:hypothetical protein
VNNTDAGALLRAGRSISVEAIYPRLQPIRMFERSYWMMIDIDLRRLSRDRAISDFILEELGAQRSIFRS